MRHSHRLVVAAAVVLVAVCGSYTGFWFIAAGRIESGVGEWAQSLRAQNIELSWRDIGVDGFPLGFRVRLREVRLKDRAGPPGGEAQTALLEGSARPWNFRVWQVAAPDGLNATAGPAGRPTASLQVRRLDGWVAIAAEGGAAVWLGLSDPAAETGSHIAASHADLWLNLPAHPPQKHTERGLGIALHVRDLTLPTAPSPFRNPLDEISFGVTVKGALPTAPLRRAATAWRDEGGTIELDHFALRWGALSVTGSGTLALDADLQPIGGFSGAIEGYQQLMAGLVAAGRMRPGDARLAGLALAMLSRTGSDGRPQIATSFRIQDGQMYLGPAPLGPAPRIAWQ